MSILSKKLKSLIFIFFISILISSSLCFFYPVKNKIFFSVKSFLFKTPDVGYYNYKQIDNKLVATADEHFLYIDNINSFIKDIRINLRKPLDENISLKLFVGDTDLGSSLLVYEAENKPLYRYNIHIDRNIKEIVIVAGDKKGDSFYLDNIVCNNNTFYFSGINWQDCFLQLKNINFWIRFLILLTFLIFLFSHFFFNVNVLYNWLYKKRYFIGLGIILFAIVFELNNSSIGLWNLLSTDFSQEQSDIIFGKARDIRSDEYAVYTPMLFSQDSDYGYFNNYLRGTKTDVFMVYGQPVKNIVSVFRPFLLEFLFLGTAKGLSFFWILRLVLLFLISFEFLMLISNKNKIISLVGTLLITFAPVVQWWWTPSGIVEIIIYGELLILLLSNYIVQKSFIKRVIMIFFIMLFIGSFLFVLYPAWQVPIGYILAAIILWAFIENYKNFKFDKKDILPISVFSILFIIALIYIFNKSKETMDLVTNTVYPGIRFETGGDKYTEFDAGCNSFVHVFRYWGNIFLPIFNTNLKTQPCNFAVFFDLFPIGLIVSAIVLFKDKIKDKLLIMLLCLYLFFAVWCAVGFPKFLAQITMMKVSPAYRTFVVLGFLNVLIFVRSVSLVKYKMNKIHSSVVSFILASLIVVSNIFIYGQYFDIFKIFIVSILSFILFYLILRNRINKLFVFLIMLIMIVSGLFVNPIQKGIKVVTDLELSKTVKEINAQEKGLWIFEGHNFILNNFLMFQKVRTLNCTNTYPNFKFLKQLDEDNKYSNIYNRYANILMNLVHENNIMDKFVLLKQDAFLINITVNDILKLNINYIMSYRPLDEYNNDKIKFEKLYFAKTKKCDIYIYKVNRVNITGE